MRLLLGIVMGAVLAGLVAVGAGAFAFGNMDIAERDKSADISRSYELSDFESIEIAGVYELDVAVGGESYSVEISGPESELDRVEASVKDGRLVLDMRDRRRGERRWKNDGLTARVAMPALRNLDISGVVSGRVEGVAADSFSVDLSGVGKVRISGECGRLDAEVSGIGEFDAESLRCEDVRIDVSGIGKAKVYASQSVTASVSGMGSVDVFGSPANVTNNGGPFSSVNVK